MDEGLVFWVILLAVAALQAISRKKRKPGQPGQKPPGLARPRPSPPQARERVTASSGPTQASSRPDQDDGDEEPSEGMIPQDVWAEILGLARGDPQRAEPDPPPEVVPIPASREEMPREGQLREESPRQERSAASTAPREEPVRVASRQFPSSHGANAVLHQSKPGDYESRLAVSRSPPGDYESRLAVSRSPARDSGEGETVGIRAELFGSGSAGDLRKAIILSEVLGPPHALKEEGG